MPIEIPKTRDEFLKLPIERQRAVVQKLEFLSKPVEEQRSIVAELENAEKTGALEAAARGFGQGLTFNTLDEIIGAVRGGVRALGGEQFGEAYEEETELARRGFRKAERDRPAITGAGQIAGAVLPTLAAPASAIPRTLGGRLAAGTGLGGLAGAGAAEEKPGTEEFRHSVKAGLAGGALGQAAGGLGKIVIGKTGKVAGGLSKAIGAAASKADKSGFIPKIMVRTAKKQIPQGMAKGFDKAIKLMERNELPAEQAGALMRGLQSGGAGLAGAYMNLINNDVEFARAMEAGEIKPPPGKLGDFVPKAFTEESKSTMGGRIQAGLDDILGVDQIGLDPGEKPYAGQPTEDDRAAMALVPLFAGITKKVTSLNPEKIKELLEKKGKKLSGVDEERLRILNKPGMSQERKDKLIDRINEGIRGKGEGGSLGDIEIKKNRRERAVWRDAKKSYDRIIDAIPPKKYFKLEEQIQKKYPGDPTKMGYDERLELIAKTMSGDIKKAANTALRRHKFFMKNPKLAEEMSDINNRYDLLSGDERQKLLERLDDIEEQILEFKMPDTKAIASSRKKLDDLRKDLPSGETLDKVADNNWSLYNTLQKLNEDLESLDLERISASKLSSLKKKKAEAMKEYQEWSSRNKILDDVFQADKYKQPVSKEQDINAMVGRKLRGLEGGAKGVKEMELRRMQRDLNYLKSRHLTQEDYEVLAKIPKASKKTLLEMQDKHKKDEFLSKAIDYWLLKKGDKLPLKDMKKIKDVNKVTYKDHKIEREGDIYMVRGPRGAEIDIAGFDSLDEAKRAIDDPSNYFQTLKKSQRKTTPKGRETKVDTEDLIRDLRKSERITELKEEVRQLRKIQKEVGHDDSMEKAIEAMQDTIKDLKKSLNKPKKGK